MQNNYKDSVMKNLIRKVIAYVLLGIGFLSAKGQDAAKVEFF
jgi:hypothetical protein